MNTKNWRIRYYNGDENDFFFIEGDLPNAEENGFYPRLEVMQEDYGYHNGYTRELRMEDAKLIVAAPGMRQAIEDVLYHLEYEYDEMEIDWVKQYLSESIKDLEQP